MSTTLTVNGTGYNQSGRKANSLLVDGFGWDVDGDYWLEFHEVCAGPQPRFTGPASVSLSNAGGTLFAGQIAGVQPAYDGPMRTWGYRCLGLKYLADWIPVTATDGSGYIRFNVSPTNPQYYNASLAGQSVGQIISYCLSQHSAALSAIGVTTDATTSSELGALTLVPVDEVDVAGEHLWSAMEGVLRKWARNIRLVILPGGLVRVVDVTAGAAHTLTLGTDPVDPPLFSRNWTTCATRVTVRGRGVIEPGYVSTLAGSLTPAWNSTEQSSWTYGAFTNPAGACTDSGTVTTVNSPTQVTVKSSNAARTWAANYWDGLQAWIYLSSSTGTGLTYTESRPITSCSALAAGGTATINLAYDLQNSGASAYNSYQIIATNVPLSSGGLYDVWRLYNVTDPGGQIANHLVMNFPAQVPFIGVNGQSATLTSFPTCQIVGPNGAGPAQFNVLPATGQVLFIRPTVEGINSTSALNSGSYVTPSNVYMLLAYSRGALSTSYPSSGYTGTAYTKAGLQRTQTVDVYNWGYAGNVSPMNNLAQMLAVSVSNTLVEGTVRYKGWYAATQDPTGGHLLNIAAAHYTTGDEALNIPVRTWSVRFLNAGGGLNYLTEMHTSTRQDPRTGADQYMHLSNLGSGLRLRPFEAGAGSFGAGGASYLVSNSAAAMTGTGIGPGGGWDSGDDDSPRGPRRRRRRLLSREAREEAAGRHEEIEAERRRSAEVAAADREQWSHAERDAAAERHGEADAGRRRSAEVAAADHDQHKHDGRDGLSRSERAAVDADQAESARRVAARLKRRPTPEQERSAPGQGDLAEGG